MKVLVMPSNSSGWVTHCLARETGKLGHLYSPGGERGPWPWLPYALDNGAYSCWNEETNVFDDAKWKVVEGAWRSLVAWSMEKSQRPLWALVPDVPNEIPRAFAVQDGMTVDHVRLEVYPKPDVIFVGGSTEWKWSTWEMWAAAFPHVHIGRVNSPKRLYELEQHAHVKSCDGTGWFRGDPVQTSGLEVWARRGEQFPNTQVIHPFLKASPSRKRKTYAPPA